MNRGKTEWYCTLGGETRIGPISQDELYSLAKSGKILSHDKVWKKGWPDWVDADQIEDLSAELSTRPPPLQPQSKTHKEDSPRIPASIRTKRLLKTLGWVFMIALIFGAIKFCGSQIQSATNNDTSSNNVERPASRPMNELDLAHAAEQQNKKLPVAVDNFTALIRIDAGPGMLATYHLQITVDGLSRNILTLEVIESMRRDALKETCKTHKWGLDSGVTYVFVYHSDNTELFRFSFSNQDCT